jgi:hypothetical protein
MIHATTAVKDEDLQQILDLQAQNLKQNLSDRIRKEQGFVTMQFSISMLRALKYLSPSIVLKIDNQILAYALVFLKKGIDFYPEMNSLIENLRNIQWKGKRLSDWNYYIMGQVCVAENLRGTGAFDLLYHKHRELMGSKYDCLVTEIATSNTRSLRAHQRIGFKPVAVHRDELDEWQVVVWDWS